MFRDGGPPSGRPPPGEFCGISESGALDCDEPDEVGGAEFTARIGFAQSEGLIERPAREVGDNMADNKSLKV